MSRYFCFGDEPFYRPNFEIAMKRSNTTYSINDSKCLSQLANFENQLRYPLSECLKSFVANVGWLKINDYIIHIEPCLNNMKGIVVSNHQNHTYLYQADGHLRKYSNEGDVEWVFPHFQFFIEHCAFGDRKFDLKQFINLKECDFFISWIQNAIDHFQDSENDQIFPYVRRWKNLLSKEYSRSIYTWSDLHASFSIIDELCSALDSDFNQEHMLIPISNLCSKLTSVLHESIYKDIPPLRYGSTWMQDLELIKQKGLSALYLSNSDEDGWLLIHCAALVGDLDAVKWMYQQDPILLESKVDHGETCLHLAASKGHIELAKWILSKEPKLLYIANSHSALPILDAARNGHLELIKLFVGFDPLLLYKQGDFDSDYPIHMAARYGHQMIIDWILCFDPSLGHIGNSKGELAFDLISNI